MSEVGQTLVPVTGEILPLDAPTDVLVDAMFRIRDLEQQLAAARRDLGIEVTARADKENIRSYEVDGFRVTVSKPGVDWDLEMLDEVLGELVDAGVLSQRAVDGLFKVERKLQARPLSNLLGGLSEEDAARVRACSEQSRRVRSVKVEDRAGGRGWSA